MAQETIWIKSGKSQLARPRVGSHVITQDGMKKAKAGDMMEKDEHGDLHLILAIDVEGEARKYDAGIAKLEKAR